LADGKVVISTALDNGGLEKGLKGITGKLGGLKSVVTGVATGITAAFSAAAVAVGAVTKQAVDAYADYEQLAGGVETLFKDASSKVMAYAEDAFYTVGLSANEYMETVTSFSASLISSLGGDTTKAADIANMALVDIADNAAKLGSSLESIKTAYQGFAKGQYQLLDNLKIGYGGSKTEMERLLKDAQAITGVKYDISNLADVYNAIHAIQEKLGIAGTTAREAEKTISGSANMTKAAWKNVLAAISGGGDLDKAINNLVYSLTKYFDNIVPVVQRALLGVGELVEKIGPMLVQNVASALIQALPSLMNAVHQMLIGLAKGIYQGIAALFSGEAAEISAQLSETDTSSLDGLASGFDAATESAEDTAKAAKKVEKSLAGFDEIQKLGGKDKDDGTDPTGLLGGTSIPAAEIAVTPKIDGDNVLLDKVRNFVLELRELFSPLETALSGLFQPLGDDLAWVWDNTLKPFSEWVTGTLLPLSIVSLAEGIESIGTACDVAREPLQRFWEDTLSPIVEQIGVWIEDTIVQVTDSFAYFEEKLTEYEDEIGVVVDGIGAAVQLIWASISPVINSIVGEFGKAFEITTNFFFSMIQMIAGWIEMVKNFALAIKNFLQGNFDEAGGYLRKSMSGMINMLIGMVNACASILNSLWSAVFSAIRGVVNSIGGIISKIGSFAGFNWDLSWEAETPLIPLIPKYVPALAQGAVLPPNKPFLAMVGDQRHGTNVEAPLETIQQAVALVMEDLIRSNIAGHEATVSVLKDILEALLGIEIGDSVLGEAVARYNSKMDIIRGGA
jgi:phage-related protein